jgi:[acyl-carrier-protein] S-malonyltransferase
MSVALIFPGQGSQYIGMGKTLCDNFAIAKETLEEASDVLGLNMKKLCFEGNGNLNLNKTSEVQLAVFSVSMAAFHVYMEQVGITPLITAGHSLGEFTALVSSERLSFVDALKLVKFRGKFMQQASEQHPGQMLSVFHASVTELEEICKSIYIKTGPIGIACDNSEVQKVISGCVNAMTECMLLLKDRSIAHQLINRTDAFHSSCMQTAANQMGNVLKHLTISEGRWPVISNVDALPHTSEKEVRKLLIQQITYPVRWRQTIQLMNNMGVNTFIEIGPKAILGNMLNKRNSQYCTHSLDTGFEIDEINSSILNSTSELPTIQNSSEKSLLFVGNCLKAAISVPNRNKNKEQFQDAFEAYKKIETIKSFLREGQVPLNLSLIQQLFSELKMIWKVKKVPVNEQNSLIKDLLKGTGNDFSQEQWILL